MTCCSMLGPSPTTPAAATEPYCCWIVLLLLLLLQVPFLLDQFEAVQNSVGLTGWGKHTLAGRPLVILADKDKDEMDSLVSVITLS